MVTIKVRQNGSLLVEGEDVKLIDWNGAEYIVLAYGAGSQTGLLGLALP